LIFLNLILKNWKNVMQYMKGKGMKTSNKILLVLGVIPFIIILMMIFSYRNELEKGIDPEIQSPDYSDYPARSYDFTDFNQIRIAGTWRFALSGGDKFRVEVRAPENVLEEVSVTKSENKLNIESENYSFPISNRPLITITMPTVSMLDLNGQGDVKISNFNLPALDVYIKGVIGLKGYNSSVERLSVKGDGALNIDFKDMPASNVLFVFNGAYMIEMQMNGGELAGGLKGPGKLMIEGKVSRNTVKTDNPDNITYKYTP
jgi:hypothetical protein